MMIPDSTRITTLNFVLFLFFTIHFCQLECSTNVVSPAFIYGQDSSSFYTSANNNIVYRSKRATKSCGGVTCRHGGVCENHQCKCSEDFMGHDCSIERCGNGWCKKSSCKTSKDNKHKTCVCTIREGGPDCSGTKCRAMSANSPPLLCFNGGSCNGSEMCNCRSGYLDDGSGCLKKICPNGDVCYSNNGICTATGCKCRLNTTTGFDCSRKTCGKSGLICHNGGTCIHEKHCQCLYGWSGVNCDGRKCPGFSDLVCHSATCPAIGSAPICLCPGNAKGKDCSGIACGSKGLACYNGGTCDEVTSTCSCVAGYGGADCRAVKCVGYSNLYCYNGGCPTAGGDADAQCSCSDPYTGADCSQVMCGHSAVTCYNGGECIDGQTCSCPPGYGGVDCRGLPCGSEFCYNDGECVTDKNSGEMKCQCTGNYTLADCSGEKCSENGPICRNGAGCHQTTEGGDFTCECTGHWAGAVCSATPCRSALCYNDGYCDDDGKDKDGCVCVNGWQGPDCRAKSCGPHGPVCHNDGACVPSSNSSSFPCQCKAPWSGPTCEEQVCGTDGLVCLNSGVCSPAVPGQTSATCTCSFGFAGDDCSASACGSEGGACYNGGRCNETTGTCICPPPLTSDDCRGNVCGAGTANSIVCQNDGVCILNAEGDWACNCTRGWTGPYCMLHMCGDDPSSNLTCAHEGTCVHSPITGALSCTCQPHWTGVDCSGMRCTEPEITCYNQVDFDVKVCTPRGCDCLNDGYGADCRGVRCGSGRCFNGATCLDPYEAICSPCPPGVNGKDCSQTPCPGVPSGICFHGGVCIGGTSCLCGFRNPWSGVDCSERLCEGGYVCLNNGVCTNATAAQCNCLPQFNGTTCAQRL